MAPIDKYKHPAYNLVSFQNSLRGDLQISSNPRKIYQIGMLQAVIGFGRSMPPLRVALSKGKIALQVPKTALNHHIVGYCFCTTNRPPQNNARKKYLLQRRSSAFILPLNSEYGQWLQNEHIIKVDKTSIIGELMRHGGEAFLLMNMRRSGKSATLKMLKTFFELNFIRTSENSLIDFFILQFYKIRRKVVSRQRQQNTIVIGGEVIKILPKLTCFEGKKISQHPEWEQYKRHQNNHPVIFMDWKGSDAKSYVGIKRFIAQQIQSVYEQYDFLRQKKLFQQFQRILDQIIFSTDEQAREISLDGVLLYLMKELYNFFGRKVLVLIDQYDNPYNAILFAEINEKDPEKKKHLENERKQVAQLLKSILSSALKSVSQLYKGVLTGVYDTLAKDGASGFNNVQVFTMADPGFRSAFGFTKTEIEEQIINKIFQTQGEQSENINRLLKMLEQNFNGYIVPCKREESESGLDQFKKIYNAYSVMTFLSECYLSGKIPYPKNYWQTGGAAMEARELFFGNSGNQDLKLGLLSMGLKIETQVNFDPRTDLVKLDTSTDETLEEKIIYLLFHNGFITGKIITGQINEKSTLKARIPNLEMKSYFDSAFSEWMSLFVSKGEVDYEDLSTYPLLLQKACQKYVDFSPETFSEKTVQLLQYGLYCRSQIKHYTFEPQVIVEQGGRFDTLLVPKIFKKHLPTKDQKGKAISRNSEGTQEKYILLSEEKLTRQQDYQKLYVEALAQILFKNYPKYLSQGVEKVDEEAGIILRAVVVVHDVESNKVSVFTSQENTVFSLEQVQKLISHCQEADIKKKLKNKNLSLQELTSIIEEGSASQTSKSKEKCINKRMKISTRKS